MKWIVVLIFLLCRISDSTAQAESFNEKMSGLSIDGMLGFGISNNFFAINVGGPSFLVRLSKDIKIGIGALPSLYFKEGKSGAKLGVSPRVDIRSLVLIAPFFHFDTTDEWLWSVGMGYRFHKKQ